MKERYNVDLINTETMLGVTLNNINYELYRDIKNLISTNQNKEEIDILNLSSCFLKNKEKLNKKHLDVLKNKWNIFKEGNIEDTIIVRLSTVNSYDEDFSNFETITEINY